jgi:HSP20 family protein
VSALIPRPTVYVTRRSVRRPFASPFADFDALVRAAFGPSVVRPARPVARVARPAIGFHPAAEINREGDDAVVRLEVPGIDIEKDLIVEVHDGRLAIRGERRDARAAEEGGRSVREVRYGTFRRSFALPAHVTADAITATYDAGVLSVRVAGAYTVPEPVESAPVTVAVSSGETPAGRPEAESVSESVGDELPTAETPASEVPAAG